MGLTEAIIEIREIIEKTIKEMTEEEIKEIKKVKNKGGKK